MSKSAEKKKVKLKAPNPLIIMAVVLVLAGFASYIVPAGVFDRVQDPGSGRMLVDPNSFHYVAQNPVGIFDFFKAPTLGIQNAVSVIAFLLIIGGFFGILDATGAIRSGMGNMVKKMAGREIVMIPVCMVVFGCGSAFVGNFEEFLAFIPLVITVCLAMGFDSITAVAIVYCAAGAGYGGGCTQAFTVGVAQNIANLPLFSGIGLRLAAFVVLEAVSIIWVTRHAMRVKKNPQSSSMYELDRQNTDIMDMENIEPVTFRQKLVLILFVASIIVLIIGVTQFGFYINELAALFLITGLLAGVVGGLGANSIAEAFVKGCGNLIFPCLMIGMCNAATLVMTKANILDTIINFMSGLLKGLPSSLSACGMFVVQDLINILVPSGSGQAAVTMPLMAPLGDLLGLTRQTSVLAFQFGDAFTNIIAPTSGTMMAALAMGKIGYGKWVKFFLPLIAMWWVIAFAFLIFAVKIRYGPF